MRRAVAVAFFLLNLASCSRRQNTQDPPLVEEEHPELMLSTLHVADPKAVPQLLKGWHAVEQGSWRWTQKTFAVALKAPSPGKSAKLQLKFVIPPPLLSRLHSITLNASIDGVSLGPETYNQAGDQTYTRTIAPRETSGNLIRVDFQLDKALPPDHRDKRELGVVVTSVGLE
jgi:hypothetical protein